MKLISFFPTALHIIVVEGGKKIDENDILTRQQICLKKKNLTV